MFLKILNFIAFVLFSIFFLPLVGIVYFVEPLWEKWTESAFNFK